MTDAKRDQYEQLLARFRDDLAPDGGQLPNVQQQAEAIGFQIGYSLAYRFDSQSGVHPTALGAEQMLEPVGQALRLRAAPPAEAAPDSYPIAAVLLLLAIEGGRNLAPFVALADGYEQTKAEIETLAPQPRPPEDALPGID